MKWIMLATIPLLISSCCCYRTQMVGYNTVAVAPVTVVRPIAIAPVVEPVSYGYYEPVDVTTTTIDFY